MNFVDEARIYVKAGDGGKGCESLYRDLWMRYARPDGGDGGKGGDVIITCDKAVHTLLDFKFKQHYQAQKGGNASSKNKTGRDANDCLLRVPVGTIIRDDSTKLVIKDLLTDQQSVIVARGGLGGRGNGRKRPPAPPKKGEERTLTLELKLVADVGVVGFPNAGKSTLVSGISKVKSKIANYPFTTRQPILGFVFGDKINFVIADLPGIIEGAHKGKGLGDRFLRHAERTKILVHLIDMAGTEGRDPYKDYVILNKELESYNEYFMVKKKILVANKMDLPAAVKNLTKFKKKVKEEILTISAQEKEGLTELKAKIEDILCRENS